VLAALKEHQLCVSFVILLFSEAVYCRLIPDNTGIKLFVLAALKEHQLCVSFVILLFSEAVYC